MKPSNETFLADEPRSHYQVITCMWIRSTPGLWRKWPRCYHPWPRCPCRAVWIFSTSRTTPRVTCSLCTAGTRGGSTGNCGQQTYLRATWWSKKPKLRCGFLFRWPWAPPTPYRYVQHRQLHELMFKTLLIKLFWEHEEIYWFKELMGGAYCYPGDDPCSGVC